MNSAAKFQTFKQSLASMGRNSQVKQQTNLNPTGSIMQPQTIQQMPMYTNPNIPASTVYQPSQIVQKSSLNSQQYISAPQSGFQSLSPRMQTNAPGTVTYQSNLNRINSPNSLSTQNNFLKIADNVNKSPNLSQIFNPRQSTMSKGVIRSAMKFDYELGGFKAGGGSGKGSAIKQAIQKPAMNVFSCMDNPNYHRQFQVSPKVMHK